MPPLLWLAAGVLGVVAVYGVCWVVQCVLQWLEPDEEG